MKHLFTLKTLLFALMCVMGVGSSWAYTLPTTTMDLGTITSSTMGTWSETTCYSLSTDYLVVSAYASKNSAGTASNKQSWITQASLGSSNASWDAPADDVFNGSSYYATGAYTTFQSGREMTFRVKNCKQVRIYCKNNGTTKYIDVNIYEITKGTAASSSTYNLNNTATKEDMVLSQTLTASKEYAIHITATGTSNSRVYEIAFERNASTDPSIAASNVTIDADATSGSITYDITNAKTGATLSASTTATWLSNLAVDAENSKVTFTSTANTSTTDSRDATVTLTYKGSDNKTLATKDVTVTQSKHIDYTTYDKVSASSMVIGGTYVWYGQKSDGTGYVATGISGTNTYLGLKTLANDSKIDGTQLKLTTETPQQFIFSQVDANDWTIADAGTPTNYIYVSGEKKIAWGTTANVWALSGTDEPQFACSSYHNTAYTMFCNSGSTRFNAYTAIGTMQKAILYHLASEATSTLTLNYNDGATTKSYIIKEGFSWNLLTPERDGYVFNGWATTATGTVAYADKAAYTMGADDATLYAQWTQQTAAPKITTDLSATYSVQKTKSVTLSIVAEDADEYEWYTNTTASTEGATKIADATEASYTYSASETVGNVTYVFCIAKNSVGNTTSTIAAVTTTGRTDCQLLSVQFYNYFYGAITHPSGENNGTIEVRYIEGYYAPAIDDSTIKVSDGATFTYSGSDIEVTAEDGTTKATYKVNRQPVAPLSVTADIATTNFTDVPSWIYNHYGYDDTKGIKFAKNVNDDGTQRVTFGNTRQYYFIGPAKKLTLTSATASRNIKVYRDGELLSTPTATGDAGATIEIELDETYPCMITIESNQTGGDGGFKAYAIEASEPEPTSYKINFSAAKYSTFYDSRHNYFMPEGCVGLTASYNTYDKQLKLEVAYTAGDPVAAGIPLIIRSDSEEEKTLEFTDFPGKGITSVNILLGTDEETVIENNDVFYHYALSLNAAGDPNSVGFYWMAADGAAFTNGAHKAYIMLQKCDFENNAKSAFVFNDDATGISSIDNGQLTIENGKFIENGRIVIKKNGNKFNTAGQLIK